MIPKILLVDDEPAAIFGLTRYLTKAGYSVQEATCLSEARDAIIAQHFDAVLLDLKLPDGSGIDWIGEIREHRPDAAVIVITGHAELSLAVEAMRRGADNFLAKPVSMPELDIFLKKSLELGSLRRLDMTRQRLQKENAFYFGDSQQMKNVLELASIASQNDSAVLIQGETGSGKGVLAKWIFENSSRNKRYFVDINCSGLRGELLASELFGHVKGAFTSATQDRQGLIELADGGTLFLDEIADMDIAVQAQLLKVLEEKSYRRLGDSRSRKSNFRLIAATNRDLEKETASGTFRKDLFFRISLFPVRIPPLRERTGDIPGLIKNLLREMPYVSHQVSDGILPQLIAYPWPGNIRELKNVLERAVLLAKGGPLKPDHFHGLTLDAAMAQTADVFPKGLDEVGEAHMRSVVEACGGDVEKAAVALKMSRSTLYRKLKKMRRT